MQASKVLAVQFKKIHMEYNQGQPNARGSFAEGIDSQDQNGELVTNVSNFERGVSIGVGALLINSSIQNFKRTPVRCEGFAFGQRR